MKPSKTKHTPGPWAWREIGKTYVLWGEHGHRPIVLDCYRNKLRMRNEHVLMEPISPQHPDAKLIAAAPELLAALQAILKGPIDEPQIDLSGEYETGLFCGLEDRDLQADAYGACRYGFEAGVERALEWAQSIAAEAEATE